VFFLVLARDRSEIARKCEELDNLGIPYVVVCGEKVNHPNLVYREPRGKYDAINFGFKFIPKDTEIVGLNDVDTEIHNLKAAYYLLEQTASSLVFAKVTVIQGPQRLFYRLLDTLRRKVPIAASGELMLIKYDVLQTMLPLKQCKAEDSYILFKVLELGGKVEFCEDCYVTTERTKDARQEEHYKRRTVGGIYQALSMAKAPFGIKLFYGLLPFLAPLLLVLGVRGYYWARGIIEGYGDYLKGDRTGTWQSTY
jgi:cellulose synthase/poly-beta-1,6-N-acetylglucosamine synthase-like glycosyltransferase